MGNEASTPGGKINTQGASSSGVQRMDPSLRKRFKQGVNYNMKVIIRGSVGSGKTSLFRRLQGQPVLKEHLRSDQVRKYYFKVHCLFVCLPTI